MCGQWIASGYMIKNHYRNSHYADFEKYSAAALKLQTGIAVSSPCCYCASTCRTPSVHAKRCAVLFQASMMLAMLQDASRTSGSAESDVRAPQHGGDASRPSRTRKLAGSQQQANKASKNPKRSRMGRQGGSQRGKQKGPTASDAAGIVDAGSARDALRVGGAASDASQACAETRRFNLSTSAKLGIYNVVADAQTLMQRGQAVSGGSKQVEAGSRQGNSSRKGATSMRAPAGVGGHTDGQDRTSRNTGCSTAGGMVHRAGVGFFRSGVKRSRSYEYAKASSPSPMRR